MAGVDRLGWAAGDVLQAHGVRFGVRVSQPAHLSLVLARLPSGAAKERSPVVAEIFSLLGGGPGPRPGLKRFHIAYRGFRMIARSHDLPAVLNALDSEMRLFVAEHAPRRIFVHAGVVAWRGRALLLPGTSHAGKSTLVEALVRAGAHYCSDEYAVLDGRGRVHPFLSSLSLRKSDGKGATRIEARSLRSASRQASFPVSLVVMSRYRKGSRFMPRLLTQGHGVLALLENTIPARRDPAASLNVLARVTRGARVMRGDRGEAAETARMLLDQMEGVLA